MIRVIKRFFAAFILLTMVVLAAFFSAPDARADSVQQAGPAMTRPFGGGDVSVSTEKGGHIIVSITGRINALGPTGHFCVVLLNKGSDGKRRVNIDSGGNGTVRFGPLPNGRYIVNGTCTDVDGAVALMRGEGSRVVLDGRGGAGKVGTWKAPYVPRGYVAPTLTETCDLWAAGLGAAGLAATAILGPGVSTVALAATLGLRAGCAVVAQQVGDTVSAAVQFCSGLQDLLISRIPGLNDSAVGFLLPSVCSRP